MYVASRPRRARRGAAILEFSLALPVLLVLTLGTVVLALGVSQYQTVAMLAREGARWASVHGAEYQQKTGKPAVTALDVYNNAILPRAASLNPSDITYRVTWAPDNQPGSTVTVTVQCHWVPQAYLGASDLSSTSVMQINY